MHYTLTNHRLFGCFDLFLRKNEEISEEELASAYGEFEVFLSDYSSREDSILRRLHELYHTEIELTALLQFLLKHPNTFLRIYLDKTYHLVKTEIKLEYLLLQHPEYSISNEGTVLPSLHWNGSLINLMELITSLDYSGVITDASGNHLSFAGLVSAFEMLFHLHISKPYDLRADLARRKKNLSVLLPKLKENYEKNIVNCGIGSKK
ncbi:RteC domain-containing protein [Bacteroides sp.]|uniref:RteC domain-containing protein n=1 Tax=Bacteroides sp. TaxID=29523 RepID=UPI0025874533|nr:RteC domain-containing protein [Bacteroides sp.]